jgi:glycosyltransferase involved in cell wall biosynthesis
MMEAMAAGLPVISTQLPGITESAPENLVAGYCAPGQPDSMADQILQAANRRDLPSSEKDRSSTDAMERRQISGKAFRRTSESIRPGSFNPLVRSQRARANWDSPY